MDVDVCESRSTMINGHSIQIHCGVADLLKECDYICNVLPKTRETDNILGGGKLEHCKGIVKNTNLFQNSVIVYKPLEAIYPDSIKFSIFSKF